MAHFQLGPNSDAATYRCVPCRTAGRSTRGAHRRVVRDQALAEFINARHGTAVKAGSAYALCVEHLNFIDQERRLLAAQ